MISIGIISTAEINHQSLLGPVKKRSDCQVTAIASQSRCKAQTYAKVHDIPKSYGDYQSLLNDPKIDAVYISTPNSLHDFWIEKALQARKHVLCEKPAFTKKESAVFLEKLALTQNLLLMEAMHYKYYPTLKDFFLLLDQKILGDIRFVKASLRYYKPTTRPNDIRLNADLKGGSFMHLGCYCLDVITTIIPKPLFFQDLKVLEQTHSVDLTCQGHLATSDKKMHAEFFCDFSGHIFDSEIEVRGEKGFMRLKSGMNPTNFILGSFRDAWTLETDLYPKPFLSRGAGLSTYDYQLDSFIESLKQKNLTPKINRQASELVTKGWQLLSLQKQAA